MITGNTAKKLNDREITTDTEKTTQATIGETPQMGLSEKPKNRTTNLETARNTEAKQY